MANQVRLTCPKCRGFLRDHIESISKNPYFTPHLDECTDLVLDLTRYITRASIYGGKTRANLYMKSNNQLYYSFVFKVVKGNTIQTRLEKELKYLRLWLLERTFLKSYTKTDPFYTIDAFIDTNLIQILDLVYEVHDAHSTLRVIEMVEEDDWAEYEAISP